MGAQAYCEEQATESFGETELVELLQTVVSLRQEVRSMAKDIRVALHDNAQLKQEVEVLRARDGVRDREIDDERDGFGPSERETGGQGWAQGGRGASEVLRIKQELQDQLERARRVDAAGRARQSEDSCREPRGCGGGADPRWMKKMMMIMMMSDLV